MKSLILCTFFFNVCASDVFSDCLKKVENVRPRVDVKCANQLEKLCTRHDLLFTFWDASSRQIHSGLTATDNTNLGNYDLCISIDEKVDNVTILGKYCPDQWEASIPKKNLEELIAVLEVYNPITPKKIYGLFQENSVGNIIQYETGTMEQIELVGSVCIPDACSAKEFRQVFNQYLYPVRDFGIDQYLCSTKESISMTTFEVIVTICLCCILLLVVASTFYHIWISNRGDEPHDLIKAFSVLHNGRKLFIISKGEADQIQCIHGIRFLSVLWVIAGYTFFLASAGRLQFYHKDVDKWKSQLYSEYIQAAHYAIDTFFVLSGMHLSYGYMKQMQDVAVLKQIKSIPLMILNRYLRLTPALAALFFFSISIFPRLVDGPYRKLIVTYVKGPCQTYWLRYFLYIQNYSDSTEMCYIQTWYLSAEMQMFIMAPIVLIPAAIYFRKKLRFVISSLIGLTVFCVGLTIAISYIVDNYTNEHDKHLRLSNYLVGIIGGILMHSLRGKEVKINKIANLVVWFITLAVMLFLILYQHDVTENPTIDKTNLFYAIQRPIWCAGIMWIIFSCHHGCGGIVNAILSIPCFQIGSKLSYCIYVVYYMILLINYGSIRTYRLFNDYSSFYLFCGNVAASVLVAIIWTLTFEAPMIILNKMLLGRFESPRK